MSYELKTEEFAGPLDKLLELIEDKELEITKVNLASVTADFLNHLNTLSDVHPKVLADFISIASKLILIKSHTLLPSLEITKEEEGEIKDLEDRLRLYREFKQAEKNIKQLWAKKVSYSRDFFLQVKGGFYFSQSLTAGDIAKIAENIISELTVLMPKLETGKIKLISFEEKMKELLSRIQRSVSSSFSEVSKGKDKAEIVVTFLAILHLLKDNLIKVEQQNYFDDIRITKFEVRNPTA